MKSHPREKRRAAQIPPIIHEDLSSGKPAGLADSEKW